MENPAQMTPKDHTQVLEKARREVRKLLDSDAPIHDTLAELVRIIERSTPSGLLASILVLDADGKQLLHGAAPSLPDEYNEAIHGLVIGPEVGSCGTAAFNDETVSVFDIENNVLWARFKDLALAHGLRACWSTPIHGSDGSVLGTFANYYRVVRDPSPKDTELTALATDTAAAVIERARANGQI